VKSDLRFFMDRGMGSHLVAGGLREAGWHVVTMDDRYGKSLSQAVSDVEWIRDAAGRGEVLLCKDRRIAKNPLEVEIIRYSSARVFAIASASITG
jgi:hypothetical protein